MKHLDILNIYKLNLYQILNIMFRVKTNSIRQILQNKFKVKEYNYCTRYSEYNFEEPNIFLSQNQRSPHKIKKTFPFIFNNDLKVHCA